MAFPRWEGPPPARSSVIGATLHGWPLGMWEWAPDQAGPTCIHEQPLDLSRGLQPGLQEPLGTAHRPIAPPTATRPPLSHRGAPPIQQDPSFLLLRCTPSSFEPSHLSQPASNVPTPAVGAPSPGWHPVCPSLLCLSYHIGTTKSRDRPFCVPDRTGEGRHGCLSVQ